VWSPILQTLWKLPNSERDQIRVGLSRTYKPPRTRDLVPRRYTTNNDNSPTTPDTQGNPDLRPELAWGLDVAYETYFKGNGLASLNLFTRRIDDVTVTQLYQQDGVWIATPANGGKAEVHGLEAEAKFPLLPNVDVRANFARNWSRLNAVPKPYNRLSEQLPISANLGFDYVMTSSFTAGANYNFQGGGPTRLTQTLGSYTAAKEVVDVYGLWKMSGQSQVRLSFTNVVKQDGRIGRFYEDEDESLVRRTTTPTSTGVRLTLERKF
jgi:outer membrane receptor protein involved in Fe transport